MGRGCLLLKNRQRIESFETTGKRKSFTGFKFYTLVGRSLRQYLVSKSYKEIMPLTHDPGRCYEVRLFPLFSIIVPWSQTEGPCFPLHLTWILKGLWSVQCLLLIVLKLRVTLQGPQIPSVGLPVMGTQSSC